MEVIKLDEDRLAELLESLFDEEDGEVVVLRSGALVPFALTACCAYNYASYNGLG